MNRKFKFRVFLHNGEEFHKGSWVCWDCYKKAGERKIQQFTGSPDKNNNPIYESDVVLWDQQDPFDCTPSKAKKVVGWNQRCMQFRLYNHPTEIGQSGGEEFLAEDVVVIGNIFDWRNEECRYLLDESVKDKL